MTSPIPISDTNNAFVYNMYNKQRIEHVDAFLLEHYPTIYDVYKKFHLITLLQSINNFYTLFLPIQTIQTKPSRQLLLNTIYKRKIPYTYHVIEIQNKYTHENVFIVENIVHFTDKQTYKITQTHYIENAEIHIIQ